MKAKLTWIDTLRLTFLVSSMLVVPTVAFSDEVVTAVNNQLVDLTAVSDAAADLSGIITVANPLPAVVDSASATAVATGVDGERRGPAGGGFGGGGRFGEQGSGRRGGAGIRHPSESQRKAFETCMANAGVQKPAEPSTEQKAAFDACSSTRSQGREAFEQCLTSQGVTPPSRPQMDSNQMQAMMACRQSAMQSE